MKARIIYKPDGKVTVIHPAPKSRKDGESEADWLKRVFERAVKGTDLEGLPYDDVDSSALPDSREDRAAWEGSPGKGIRVNKTKAAELKEAREKAALIEEEKKKLLEELAIERLKTAGKIK